MRPSIGRNLLPTIGRILLPTIGRNLRPTIGRIRLPTIGRILLPIALFGGCSPTVVASGVREPTLAERLAHLEMRYADARDLELQIEIAEGRGDERSPRGAPVAELRRAAAVATSFLLDTLGSFDSTSLGAEDRRALGRMRRHLEAIAHAIDASGHSPVDSGAPCAFDAGALARGEGGLQRLTARVYACFGRAATRIVVDRDTLDRLTILGRLATTADSGARQRLFYALAPVWRAINGDGGPESPYRVMTALGAASWRSGGSPIDAAATALGVVPDDVAQIFERILEAWRTGAGPRRIEPWDWYHVVGEASRRLSPRVPRDRLRPVNDRFYTELGADPVALGVRYDLERRTGKTPVAFTQLGAVPRREGRGWRGGEAWVLATYAEGGFDNLVELLHETGHAVHLAAIAARPAFADWPDADPFTEALGDILALEAYEPAWQLRYLGDSATTPASLRAKYAGIVLDVAWALFELRMHADPARDPSAVWADIGEQYLGLVPHPELAWWAVRGQLVEAPGYMSNYALGAVVAAAVRSRMGMVTGPPYRPRRDLYGFLSERLYRFGLSRPVRVVLRDFLGAAPGPEALLADLARLGGR